MKSQPGEIICSCIEKACDSLREGIVFVDDRGRILKANTAFCDVLGFSRDELAGMPFLDLLSAGSTPRSAFRPRCHEKFSLRYFNLSCDSPLPLRIIKRDGKRLSVEMQSVVVSDEHGDTLLAAGFFPVPGHEDSGPVRADTTEDGWLWESQHPYGIITSDFTSTITNVNDTLVRMLGYESKNDLVGRCLLDLGPLHGTHMSTTGDQITIDENYYISQVACSDRLFRTGQASGIAYMFRRDGLAAPIEVALSLVAGRDGGRRGTMAMCRDITERLMAEKQTQDTNLFLRNIFSTTRDGMYVSNALGQCIMVNQAFCDMTGYTKEDLIGKSPPSLLPDTADAALNQQIIEALNGNADMSLFETGWQHKNGTVFPVEVCVAVLQNADGEDNGIVATVRDISRRVNAEKEALAAKAFLESVFINASEGMYVTDARGHFIMVNQAFCDITGYKQEELIGQYVPFFLPFDPGLTFKEYDLDTVSMHDDFSRFETRWQRRDGRNFFVEVRLAVLKNANGEDDGLVGIVCDTTARKSMEDALEARVRERTASLEEMNKALTVLLRGREEDKKTLEEKILLNLSELVFPYLDKLKTTRLDERQHSSLSIIEANLKDILTPFALRASGRNHALTQSELRIANLIRQGMTSKDIAQITGLSTRTIDHRRESIRNKLGITDRRTPLSSYLLSSF